MFVVYVFVSVSYRSKNRQNLQVIYFYPRSLPTANWEMKVQDNPYLKQTTNTAKKKKSVAV